MLVWDLCTQKNFCMIFGKNFLVVFEELNKIALHKAPSMFYILNTTCFLNVRNIYLSSLNKRDSVGIGLNSDNGHKQGSKPLNRAFGPVQSFEINSLSGWNHFHPPPKKKGTIDPPPPLLFTFN